MNSHQDNLPFDKQLLHYAVITLDKLKFSHHTILSDHARDHIKVTGDFSPVKDLVRGTLFTFETELLAEKVVDENVDVDFSHPTTWWDMFKIRFFPRWLLYRFPPMYTLVTRHINFKKYAAYPQLPKLMGEDEVGPVRIHIAKTVF